MKIAEFGHKHLYESTGGIEVVVTELVERLAKNGNLVTVFDRGELDKIAEPFPAETVPLSGMTLLRLEKYTAPFTQLSSLP